MTLIAPLIFWRMRGEVEQPGTVAPVHDRHESGLRDRLQRNAAIERYEGHVTCCHRGSLDMITENTRPYSIWG